ncbi:MULTISPECIES: DUF4396 domain-containing protein [Methylobacterium]|uniref:Integral membrane protein n=2 Tax=Methylobacterium TaxID=407 RepID=A0A089Q7Z4_9HYPH|nr:MULTISPECIES: DUF4396 domain-containing protein [Methylobacterium]ACB24530.1 putative integral membrane protein [Methylobacterium radiotolerans JCM 2831]AIQ90704.1 Putative integral membrane protein [Methylobacterium oryzae CBMB20]GEN01305.1 membrane protein [Methylobacterium radiotolerans]
MSAAFAAPGWLHALAVASLLLGAACSLLLSVQVIRHPQHMAVMNVVWPVCALFGTLAVVWAYYRYGRLATMEAHHHAMERDEKPPNMTRTPFPVMVGKGALHCGSGCMLGDVAAEWLAFLVPAVAVWFGWHSLFEEKMYAVWILDFVFAYALGIVFQYYAIVPMRGLSPGEGLVAAVKADTLSLISWQVGMYGFMAFAQFYLFPHLAGDRASVNSVEFWFAMQVAMVAGFLTSYPVNWWLVSSGVKERM